MRRKPGRKAGLHLEALVSEELDRLNVPHRRTEHMGEEDTQEQIDLVVEAAQFSGLPEFEFQLTLQRGVLRKMRAFTLAALTNPHRGIRVYLEVWASKWNKLGDIARRVAYAIRDITRFRKFDEHNILGIKLKVGRSVRGQKLERFSLMNLVGEWVLTKIAERKRLAEERRQEQLRKLRERIRDRRRRHTFPTPEPIVPVTIMIPRAHLWNTHAMPARMFVPIRQP